MFIRADETSYDTDFPSWPSFLGNLRCSQFFIFYSHDSMESAIRSLSFFEIADRSTDSSSVGSHK